MPKQNHSSAPPPAYMDNVNNERVLKLRKQSGSILLEAVIMIGLVAALIPILYTHIANRKEEIKNINKANVMLHLQRETQNFLNDADKRAALDEALTAAGGKLAKNPSYLGSHINASLDNHYTIGFKKSGDDINAIIVEKIGSANDVKAAEIARLIGTSAGIKSSMNSDTVYGVNGLWRETVADYGVSAPAGSTVITTEYTKTGNAFYTSDMLIDSDIDLGAYKLYSGTGNNKIVVNRLCIGGQEENNCRTSWADVDTNLMLLKKCYARVRLDDRGSNYCKKVTERHLSDNCTSVANTYSAAILEAPSGYYYLGTGFVRKACYFVKGAVPTAAELSTACSGGDTYACEASGNY